MTSAVRRRIRLGSVAALTACLALSACAESERDSGDSGGGDGGGSGSGTLVFAGSAEPVSLDPFFASDGESFRVARQIFEGLVGTKPGTADPAPLLAKEWTVAEDGLSYDFTLQEGVKFSDGTPFDGEAVCANFDRWFNAPKSAQSPDLTYYYGSLMRGFATGPTASKALYKSCEAGDGTAKISLNKPFAGFVSALSLPAFSMQSPTALEKYQDDAASNPTTTDYSTANPTGTGPFVLDSWKRGDRVTLTPNKDYWGEQKAQISKLIFVAIDDPKARATALQNGEIDGFDLVGPADIAPLEEAGFQIVNREPFNVLYLGFNQAVKPLDDLKVRQAIAYAIDKEAVAKASMPEGTKIATQFMPDVVNGWTDDVPTYDYDPEKAKQLLKEAGAEGATIEFNYPSDVSRPYMPQPEDTFNVIRSQLQAVGLEVKATSDRWDPDYLNKIQGTEKHGIHLLGWTGDYNDSDNFVGVFFGQKTPEWGFTNDKLFSDLDKARALPTVEEQKPLYEAINKEIMEFLPGVPLAHPVPSLAFAEKVQGFEASPVQDEVYNTVTIEE